MTASERQVWDFPLRLFHWALVISVITAFVTNKLGIAYFDYHLWSGYTVIVLVAFRLIWGLVGTRHARFTAFVRGPAAILSYGRGMLRGDAPVYPGHNPVGALMVLVLLAGLGGHAVLGLFGNDDILNVGPLSGYVSKDVSLLLTSVHRRLFYGIIAAVLLHVAAIAAYRWIKGENLVIPMITGRKPAHLLPEGEAIASSRLGLATIVLLTLAAGLAWVITQAPAVMDFYQ